MKRYKLMYNYIIIVVALLFGHPVKTTVGQGNMINPYQIDNSEPKKIEGMKLVWHDEFDYTGKPNSEYWGYEYGFVRNRELQWYQPQNATCKGGRLIIEGKGDMIMNPNYNPHSSDWRSIDEYARYSSACIITKGMIQWEPEGYFEFRARIDTTMGSWPAIWLLGTNDNWPYGGEIDVMEFYRLNKTPTILANAAWGGEKNRSVKWSSTTKPLSEFMAEDPDWVKKYHIWSMEWDEETIKVYIDYNHIHTTYLDSTHNSNGINPFKKTGNEFYILLNLAIGSNGGKPINSRLPIHFEVDYVRVYKPVNE